MVSNGKRRTIPYNFSDKHKQYIRDCRENVYNVAEGAIRAGKTIDNVIAFAYELKRTRDKIHLATGSTGPNAKLNIGDANGFGLEHIFRGQCRWGKYKDNMALLIKGPSTRNRERVVIFAGGGKADSYKSIRGNSFGMWIATEINLHHPSFIQEAFNRTAAAHIRKFFWDLNPENPSAGIYKDYLDTYAEKQAKGEMIGGYNYQHFSMTDNANISEQRQKEIASQYEKGSLWYMRDILGKRVRAEGLVYDLFRRDEHVIEGAREKYARYYVACDYGTQNPTVFLLFGEAKPGTWHIVDEYYYSGRDEGKQKTDQEYVTDLINFIDNKPVPGVICDPSAASLMEEMRRRGVRPIRANNEVLPGIRRNSSELEAGRIKIYERCENTIREMESYSWDSKASDRGEDVPIKDNDHCMDAWRYFTNTIVHGGRPRTLDKRLLGLGR